MNVSPPRSPFAASTAAATPFRGAHAHVPSVDAPLPASWEARPRFDGGWDLGRSGRARQALAIRWATLALGTLTAGVFLFGHSLLALVGRGIEPLALVLMATGVATIAWLERRGPVYRLAAGRIERRSGLAGRSVRTYEDPSLVICGVAEDRWALVLRHPDVPEILAPSLSGADALALAAFIAGHGGASVDLPDALERQLAEDGDVSAESEERPLRTGTSG